MKNIYVISGVAGMTGSELVRQILHRESECYIIGFDNFFASDINTIKDYLDDERFIFKELDINNHYEVKSWIGFQSIKVAFDRLIFINCAAVVHTKHFYEVSHTWYTNVISMKWFLELAINIGADTFINCSTSEVYSMQSWAEGGVKESDYLLMSTAEHSQRTSYACGKLMTEFFIQDAVHKNLIKGCSIRFANVYSKNEKYADHIIPHIVESLKVSDEVVLLENSRVNKRTFLNNIDSCAAVLSLIDTESALDGTVYNVATQEEISILDLVDKISKKMSKTAKIKFSGYRKSDPERRLLNTDKITERTKWKPIVSLDEGLDICIKSRV